MSYSDVLQEWLGRTKVSDNVYKGVAEIALSDIVYTTPNRQRDNNRWRDNASSVIDWRTDLQPASQSTCLGGSNG